MNDGGSLINIPDLGKPATVLIEKISEGVGGYFKPHQIKRVAKAEAEAELIMAQAKIDKGNLQQRAVNRFVVEEMNKQQNMENITEKAIPLLDESAQPQDIENDWIANFFDKSRIVSDEEMQSLWSKVLAGEANSPGSYSKRTVNFLGSLDKFDAHIFTSLCGFLWGVGVINPIIIDYVDGIYKDRGITFESLTHLDDIGLIRFEIGSYGRTGMPRKMVAFYYGSAYVLKFKMPEKNTLNVGSVKLSKIGQQLISICSSEPVEGFVDYIIEKWKKEGITISSADQKGGQ